ncbi:hypothetical protein [Actinoplanes sp. RD1]|uniref:hypothetical protein n=1 Tax=Actinoplanes sp. RD1 TaxID=3064538 RepID=UPI00274041DF|nr:hypothetical protein [Actinoplanes sp. RD1]
MTRPTSDEDILEGHLKQAYDPAAQRPEPADSEPTGLPSSFDAVRWFPLPAACLR